MTWLPFLCLAVGIGLGLLNPTKVALRVVDGLTTLALIGLMFVVGASIGGNAELMASLPRIGLHCLVIVALAVAGSVAATALAERTVVPLEEVGQQLRDEGILEVTGEADHGTSPLVWLMPVSIVAGLLMGKLALPPVFFERTDQALLAFLVVLYISVGITTGSNRSVFAFVRRLGLRVVWLSVACVVGSLLGGLVAAPLLGLPVHVPLMAASGMSFYSLTGAYMTQVLGAAYGTYGFVVNVFREFLTVLLLPLLRKIGKGAPIATGGAGDMDTMLAPVTKAIGAELGLVVLVTGTILTMVVPFLLPLLGTLA